MSAGKFNILKFRVGSSPFFVTYGASFLVQQNIFVSFMLYSANNYSMNFHSMVLPMRNDLFSGPTQVMSFTGYTII